MALDRKIPPHIHDAIEFDYTLPPINQTKLSNGLPLYWLDGGVQDVVEIDFVFPAGLWQEPASAIANTTAGLLKNGTSKRSAAEIHNALEFYGANLKAGASNDYGVVTLYTLTKHLGELLPVVHEIITDAIFPQHELDIYKQNSIQRLSVSQRECDFIANQRIDAVLYGEAHPYGRFTQKEKIETIKRDDVVAFHKANYNLANVKIFMAGHIGDKEVQIIDETFGKEVITGGAINDKDFPVDAAADKKSRVMNDEKGVQGAIRIGRLFPNRHHKDFAPMVVLNTIFGGYFGSRLMSNIREDKGYTYGIYSSLAPYTHSGSLTIHTEVGRDVIEPAIAEIYKEMQQLREELVDDEELLLVKNYLLGNMLGDLDGPFSIIQRWRTLILNGLTVEHFNRNIQIYKSITAADLKQLAEKYYNIEDFYEVVVI